MSAPTVGRPLPAPAEQEAPPDPVSEAARVLSLHRCNKPYGRCLGQLMLALVLEEDGFTEDPEAKS